MAPPTRLRPHLDDLLQKNLELEHVVADLRHQLTQSSAKWADERKVLATGCDALMASFAKFRARLDGHPSGWEDSEGEVEQNLLARGQSEGTGEVENAVHRCEGETEQGSLVVDNLRERCHSLAAELQVKEEELEESRRKRETAEEELQRVQRSLEVQSEQLRAALASTKADTSNTFSPARLLTPDDTSAQTAPSKPASEETLQKLNQVNQEITRLKQLVLQWQKYGSDWKRDAQAARSRLSEMEQRETALTAQAKAAQETTTLLENEKKEVQRLTSALADQTAAVEQQRSACQDNAERVQDLEATVALLRTQIPPEQLTPSDPGQSQAAPESSSPANPPSPPENPENSPASPQNPPANPPANPQGPPESSPTPRADPSPNKRSDMIILKIPSRSILSKRPLEQNDTSQDEQRNQVPTTISIPVAPGPQVNSGPLTYTASEVEMCIHTCNLKPCRNESHSFLWPRKQASLPRHALSGNKHRNCTPTCPGHRLLNMPVTEAMREPRTSKCRPPSEAELVLAAEEARMGSPNNRTGEKEARVEPEGEKRPEGSGEPEEINEPDDESRKELNQTWERWRKNRSPFQKRPRPPSTEGGPKRPKKRKLRLPKP